MRQHGQRGRTCTPPVLPPMMKERHDGSFKFKRDKKICGKNGSKTFLPVVSGVALQQLWPFSCTHEFQSQPENGE